jgi:hypothetical protein
VISQGQPRRPEGEAALQQQDMPIKYGDMFDVSGELVAQPVAPRDAPLLQTAEDIMQGLGHTQKGMPAAVIQSAATLNARTGHVGHAQLSGSIADMGVAVTETELKLRVILGALALRNSTTHCYAQVFSMIDLFVHDSAATD